MKRNSYEWKAGTVRNLPDVIPDSQNSYIHSISFNYFLIILKIHPFLFKYEYFWDILFRHYWLLLKYIFHKIKKQRI